MNDILPQIQQPVDSTDLVNQIVTKYNVSSGLAALCVSILLLYPEYQVKIKATTNQPNQNNQQQPNSQQPSQLQPLPTQQRPQQKSASTTNYSWPELRSKIVIGI